MPTNHISLPDLRYQGQVREWLIERYGEHEAAGIWADMKRNYETLLTDAPNYGGGQNGHATAIYSGLLVFALYAARYHFTQCPIAEFAKAHGLLPHSTTACE